MVPVIPNQRNSISKGGSPFSDLVKYITKDGREVTVAKELSKDEPQAQLQLNEPGFIDLVNYAIGNNEKNTDEEKCIAIRTHGVIDITTASEEMGAVAKKNTRCKDPAYHFILSWPEHEQPATDKIFDAAEHALKALGLSEHQYVLAVHGNTDNMHCHISVNRVHPITFRAHHIEWAKKTLHMAARQSEIKHGWSHDNGIYIVKTNGHGKKTIVLNPDNANAVVVSGRHAHTEEIDEKELPAWHDPESLDSWLKSKIAKELKYALPKLDSWPALHAWLDERGIELKDSGGGGMRLHATSQETGEIIDIPASKGLRILKRAALEKSWGPFTKSVDLAAQATDTSHLTPTQITQGANNVLNRTNAPGAASGGRPPSHILDRNRNLGRDPEHVLRGQQHPERDEAQAAGSLSQLPTGGVDAQGQIAGGLLQNAVPGGMGDTKTGQDNDVRRTGASQTGSRSQSQRSLNRDDSKREERKEQRALARADLRQRYAKYNRFIKDSDSANYLLIKENQMLRRQQLTQARQETKTAKKQIPKTLSYEAKFLALVEIDAKHLREKLKIESDYQAQNRTIQALRAPALPWRTWLHEQSNLGDQAALSALRGIVYQAQRDAKKKGDIEEAEIKAANAAEHSEQQYRKVMAQLLKEEQEEIAIRSANISRMRPYQVDAILIRHKGLQWHVTGNGNVEYSDLSGSHLFTDRGSRVTFDRELVTDEDIRMALVHAEHKFGRPLTLTGDDPVFVHRMACIADDLGMAILNPELQSVIAEHRKDRELEIRQSVPEQEIEILNKTPDAPQPSNEPKSVQEIQEKVLPQEQNQPDRAQDITAPLSDDIQITPIQPPSQIPEAETLPHELLRALVLSIDPQATFKVADTQSTQLHIGPIVAMPAAGSSKEFAQRTARSEYTIHEFSPPEIADDMILEIKYRNSQPMIEMKKPKGIDR